MKLEREEILNISRLARMGLSEEEIERFQGQLSNILENFEVLKQVDTTDVPPTAQSIELRSVMREDEIRESLSPDEVLANAPKREENLFRVRHVLE